MENAQALAKVSLEEIKSKKEELIISNESEKARLRQEIDAIESRLKKARDDELGAASRLALAKADVPDDVDVTIRALGIAEAEIENEEATNESVSKSMSGSSEESNTYNWILISMGLVLLIFIIFIFR